MLQNARCCCRERQTVASASYTQLKRLTGKLPQAAEVTVRRQSATTRAMPHLDHGAPRRRPPSTRGRKERHAYRSRHCSPEAAHMLSREADISCSLVVYCPDAYSHGHGTESMSHYTHRKSSPTRGDAVMQAWCRSRKRASAEAITAQHTASRCMTSDRGRLAGSSRSKCCTAVMVGTSCGRRSRCHGPSSFHPAVATVTRSPRLTSSICFDRTLTVQCAHTTSQRVKASAQGAGRWAGEDCSCSLYHVPKSATVLSTYNTGVGM